MLDQVFRRALVRERILANPIGPILQRYTSFLVTRGHQSGPLHQYIFAAEHFGHWLGGQSIDRTSVERFIGQHLSRCRCAKPAPCGVATVRAALNRLLEMLGNSSPKPADAAWADRLLRRYEQHLSGTCGLAHSTIHYRLRYAGALLTQLQLRQVRQLRAISPHQIAHYVSSAGRRCKPSSGQVVASSARSFLRFLLLHDLISRDLATAVPSFANWRLASLPKTVSRAELDKMVNLTAQSTPLGRRDRAVLLCMTELGLRAADVASLRLDSVDLIAGILRLRSPKQRNEVELPMTRRLAVAIRGYLDQGRPACQTASLFVLHRAPFGAALRPLAIRGIVRRRAAEAGLRDRIRGTHVIRHSVATQLINAGASIKQIADLLGHQSIDTTAIYAKVDLQSLASVALPWPTRLEVTP
jgi:site-specific recombinase XerD